MKARKKFKLLQGITAIRVKMGITQQRLAEYLGVSKSLVSMVENGRRSFPVHAFMCLAELEAAFHQGKILLPDADKFTGPAQAEWEHQETIRKCRERKKEIALEEWKCKLLRMKMKYDELMEQLRHLCAVQQFAAGSFDVRSLERGMQQLLKKLKSCDEKAQAVIRGKIAMLEIIVASYQPKEMKEENIESALPAVDAEQAAPFYVNLFPADLPAGRQVCERIRAA